MVTNRVYFAAKPDKSLTAASRRIKQPWVHAGLTA
jgi:hypothetical protein